MIVTFPGHTHFFYIKIRSSYMSRETTDVTTMSKRENIGYDISIMLEYG